MKATILHDEQGKIIAISKIGNLQAAGSRFTSAGMMAGPGQGLIETELSQEDAARPLCDLHTTYRVDVKAARLVKA